MTEEKYARWFNKSVFFNADINSDFWMLQMITWILYKHWVSYTSHACNPQLEVRFQQFLMSAHAYIYVFKYST